MTSSELRVAIVGAGIGGLSLALALRERGLRAQVFEQAPEPVSYTHLTLPTTPYV